MLSGNEIFFYLYAYSFGYTLLVTVPINGFVFQLIYYTFRRTYYLRSGNNGFLQAKYKHKKDVLGLD